MGGTALLSGACQTQAGARAGMVGSGAGCWQCHASRVQSGTHKGRCCTVLLSVQEAAQALLLQAIAQGDSHHASMAQRVKPRHPRQMPDWAGGSRRTCSGGSEGRPMKDAASSGVSPAAAAAACSVASSSREYRFCCCCWGWGRVGGCWACCCCCCGGGWFESCWSAVGGC